MSRTRLTFGIAALAMAVACNQPGPTTPDAAAQCGACVVSEDCPANAECLELSSGGRCVTACGAQSGCAQGWTCASGTTTSGKAVQACVAATGDCSPAPDGGAIDGGPPRGPDSGLVIVGECPPCEVSEDCSTGRLCVGLQGGSGCMSLCATNADCSDGLVCATAISSTGVEVEVCVTPTGACSVPGGSTVDAGMASSCPGYAEPDESACCSCQHGHTCSPNNCYNGYLCDTASCRCTSPASANCSTQPPDGGSTEGDAGSIGLDGGPVTSTITASGGGTESNLYFAVVGDTRPANEDDTANYPKSIITQIYKDIAGLSPMPPVVLGTGDYQYTSVDGGQQDTQLGYYTTAEQAYLTKRGIFWPTMGNHECDGWTAGECGPGSTSTYPPPNITANFTVYRTKFLTPIGETNPYYARTISAPDNSWTAKFIFVALNFWSSQQASWLTTQLATSTTYTFVIHHEDATAGNPAPLATVESQVKAAGTKVTLSIVGHNHLWQYNQGSGSASGEVVIGNGGAPLTSGTSYGYTLFERRPSDGAIVVTAYDFVTNQATHTFAVTAAGAPTQ